MPTTLRGATAVVLTALLLAGIVEAQTARESAPATDGSLPLYLQALALLRTSDSVIPPTLDVHPVSATYNREAVIPPQCYTRTEGVHNPCYVCHQNQRAGGENTMNDADLQVAYTFSDVGTTNHWLNLFENRSTRVAAMGDEEILAWIDGDNYSELPGRLEAAGFGGYVPDLAGLEQGAAAFDADGFARDGSGWVAFNYKPLPSTFWPTNGSTDDVMIRLPDAFRRTANGTLSRDAYRANLAILEANVKGLATIDTRPIDETVLDVDVDGDGALGMATRIARISSFVGAASEHLLLPPLYPQGTEFLHTVRYVGIRADGTVGISRRMKEVRYMRKSSIMPLAQLAELYREEQYAKEAGYLPGYINRWQQGLDNEMGWLVQGFIEDRNGRLRVQTYEETLFCMGCHTSLGATIDKTFAFPRKVDGAAGWGYIELHGMPDAPNVGETLGEIATYLERVGGGSEFRNNDEMLARWFAADGTLDRAKVAAADVHELISPSRERALALNKAYRTIVADQDYVFGRDAVIVPPRNVYDEVDPETAPTLGADRFFEWDIRLDWGAAHR
ncbi:MAG TPA: hypothetical protein VKA43_11630 [Gammaproteobacteria bacterium]|nr:hypothetical protein [Gammaproteobacteria bacterium]